MATYLYLSLVPEALIVSMLNPDEFGAYYACGMMRKSRGQAMFVAVDPKFRSRDFKIDDALKRCVMHENGDPKSSVYVSVYRVAERIPISAIGSLYLTTNDGRVAELARLAPPADIDDGLHLYQELLPTRPMVASTKSPLAFYEFMTNKDGDNLFALPAMYFADLRLGELATNPEFGGCDDLPYENIDHLRQCLTDIRARKAPTKIVDRNHSVVFPYRLVRTGFYFGCGNDVAFYQMPSKEEMMDKYYNWWRSSQV
ncbi:MAG: hypothetical protein ACOX9C_06900 [Kiritimatiellia bacterium]|jgi:hypothetical protein